MSNELVVQNTEIVAGTLFGTDNPAEVVERSAAIAKTLEQVVRSQNLVVQIGSSEHVRVEGWTFLGSILGVFPVVEWTRPVSVVHDGMTTENVGWEARVEARTRAGEVVGAAEAQCLRDERTWKSRDDYALRSMAQTRAVSKALRLPLGFVMQLAGFNPTPAEEMPVVDMSHPDIPFGDHPHEQLLPPSSETPIPPVSEDAPRYISEKQRTRLFTIASKAGVLEEVVREVVVHFTGQESTKLIPAGRVYDSIIDAIQRRAA